MDPVTEPNTVAKPKIATVWLGGCSGCHMSFMDLDEDLLVLNERAELVTCPLVDNKDFTPVDVTLIEGAVAHTEHLEHIKHIRKNTKILVAFGDCAISGNVTAMRNMFGVDEVLDRAYKDTSLTIIGIPTGNNIVPTLLDKVRPLHEVVKVDYFLQGCPPTADEIRKFLWDLLDGKEQPETKKRFG
jgi:NAD-reducing hydrogenase small subunit